jgi:hypothetical protein
MSESMQHVGEESKVNQAETAQAGRRNFLINPKFQLSFLGYTLGVSVATIAIFYLADAYFFWKFRQLGQGLGLPSNHVFFQFLDEQKSAKDVYYAITAGVAFAFLTVCGLLLSHRVAGPLYRLRKHLDMVAEGKTVSDVRFRKGDYFPEVADAYNLQMKRYRDAVQPEQGSDDKRKAA